MVSRIGHDSIRPHHNIIDVLNIMTSENDDKERMIESDSSSINKPLSQLKVSYNLYMIHIFDVSTVFFFLTVHSHLTFAHPLFDQL